MPASLVYAVTLNWNQPEHTLHCLQSLALVMGCNLRQIVVDNGSTDDSPQQIASQFPDVEQLINPANRGFAAGINAGLRHALARGADYVFIVNNDAWIAADALPNLLAAAAGPGVGAVGPVIYAAAAPQPVWTAGAGRNPLTFELIAQAGPTAPLSHVVEREYLCACALLITRATLERVGLFDERFFMYYEDSDYCLRVRRSGLRLLLVPAASAWHHIGASSGGAGSPDERYWMARSSVQFFRKHVRGWRWALVAPYRLASALKSSFRLLRAGKRGAASAYWRGLWDGLTR